MNGNNCIFIGAIISTKYSSKVDISYSDGVYWGNLMLDETVFGYTPKVAGNATQIAFLFKKVR